MILKNFKIVCQGKLTNSTLSGCKGLLGTSFQYFPSNNTSNTGRNIGDFTNMYNPVCAELVESGTAGVYFGTGSTPATENDYRLESPITSGLSFSNQSIAYTTDNEKVVMQSSYAVTNRTAEDITIREIGCTSYIPKYSSGSVLCMIERTVLDEPITIPAGDATSFTYKVTYNYTF